MFYNPIISQGRLLNSSYVMCILRQFLTLKRKLYIVYRSDNDHPSGSRSKPESPVKIDILRKGKYASLNSTSKDILSGYIKIFFFFSSLHKILSSAFVSALTKTCPVRFRFRASIMIAYEEVVPTGH